MGIKITRVGLLYEAEVSPPHGNGSRWKTDCPVDAEDLVRSLRKLGCHPTDVGDAFYDAEPEWLLRLSK
jgi:hypothetical protein